MKALAIPCTLLILAACRFEKPAAHDGEFEDALLKLAPAPPAVAGAPAEEVPLRAIGEPLHRALSAAPAGIIGGNRDMMLALEAAPRDESELKRKEGSDAVGQAPTRAWFPETFLFAPRVVTDASGKGSIDVLVPDRLTTWRVLALAHSRQGAQAGSVLTFSSDLPVSMDVVAPGFLMAGDRVALPIQITNGTGDVLVRDLQVKVEGGTLLNAPSSVRVEGGASASVLALIAPAAPGDLSIEARVGSDDAIRKSIPVWSSGKPERRERAGTLASRRTFKMALEGEVLPGTAIASLVVLPGALSILRTELAAAPERVSVDDDAYLLSLTGRAAALSAKLGAPIEEKLLQRLRRIASQRAARWAMTPTLSVASKLAPGALAHPADSLVRRTGEHLSSFVARAQRPDGTFVDGEGWPLQRVIVSTAEGLLAVTARGSGSDPASRAALLRARGAFERFAGQFEDPYTSAIVAATGALDPALATELKTRVMKALVQRDDGSRILPVPAGVVRADGTVPTEIECTARAILALHDHPAASALLSDLGSSVLSAYRPGFGFGDGATNRIALDAVALLFSDPLPSKVVVSLTVDGKSLGRDTLEGKRLTEVMRLDAPLAARASAAAPFDVVVESDPPLEGLSYVFAIDYAVPWPASPPDAGLTLDVEVAAPLAVGRTVDVSLRATAPGGAPIKIVQALPAGVEVVRASLDALQDAGSITSFELQEGALVLRAPPRKQGELFHARYKVVPTLAGTLHARASSGEIEGDPASIVYFPTKPWSIR